MAGFHQSILWFRHELGSRLVETQLRARVVPALEFVPPSLPSAWCPGELRTRGRSTLQEPTLRRRIDQKIRDQALPQLRYARAALHCWQWTARPGLRRRREVV